MAFLWKYLKGYRVTAAIAPFLKLAEALMELYIPLFVQKVIDDGIAGASKAAVFYNCGKIALFGVLGMAFSLTAQWFSARAAVGFSCSLRKDLFRKALCMRVSDMDTQGQAKLITRLTSDADKLQSGVNMGLRLLLRSPFVVFGSVIMAMTVNLRLGLWLLLTVVLLSVVVFGVVYGAIPLEAKAAKKLEAVTGRTRDNLRGVRVLRAFRQEENETSRFDAANADQSRAAVVAGRLTAFLNPITFAIINIALLFVISRGTLDVSTGTLKQGEVVAVYNYLAQILTELVKLATLTVTLSKAVACGGRVKKILELPEENAPVPGATDAAGAPDAVLEFRHVSFRYAGAAADTLTDISFVLKAGETLGILGGTGAGKTTLVSLIPGLYSPTSGGIFLHGRNTACMQPQELRTHIAAVPQKAKLFAESVEANLKRARVDASEEELRDALRAAVALDFVEEKEDGLKTEVLRDGSNFSGGQKQRLTIARALLKRAEILVLDDCLSALDYQTDLTVRRNIAAQNPRPATVIVSQRPSTVLQCDKIMVLDEGRCVGYGTPGELLETCETYREIYDSQYAGKDGD